MHVVHHMGRAVHHMGRAMHVVHHMGRAVHHMGRAMHVVHHMGRAVHHMGRAMHVVHHMGRAVHHMGRAMHVVHHMGRVMRKRVIGHMRTANAQISLHPRSLISTFSVRLQKHLILYNIMNYEYSKVPDQTIYLIWLIRP